MNFTEWLIEEELFESFDLDRGAVLAHRARNGDKNAETDFIRLISPFVERYVKMRMRNHPMAPEVSNDVLMAVANQFLRSTEQFNINDLPRIINSMTRHKAIDAFRATGNQDRQGNRKMGTFNTGTGMSKLASYRHHGDAGIGGEFVRELRSAMDDLPDPVDREIFTRFYFDHEGHRDISQSITNPKTGKPMPPGTVFERLSRIKKMIHARLVAKGFDASDLDNLGTTFNYVKQTNSEPLKKARGNQGNRRKMSVPGDI